MCILFIFFAESQTQNTDFNLRIYGCVDATNTNALTYKVWRVLYHDDVVHTLRAEQVNEDVSNFLMELETTALWREKQQLSCTRTDSGSCPIVT